MYEQRKNINKASAETVLSLAKVLNYYMKDLLEVWKLLARKYKSYYYLGLHFVQA